MGDRIAVMKAGGVLAQYATPRELLESPADHYVADFVGLNRGVKKAVLEHGSVSALLSEIREDAQ
jgi:osmoprotectant transport system ATP-binding protein